MLSKTNKRLIALISLIILLSIIFFLFKKNQPKKNIIIKQNKETGLYYTNKKTGGIVDEKDKKDNIPGLFKIKNLGINQKNLIKVNKEIIRLLKEKLIKLSDIIGLREKSMTGGWDKKGEIYYYQFEVVTKQKTFTIKVTENLLTKELKVSLL